MMLKVAAITMSEAYFTALRHPHKLQLANHHPSEQPGLYVSTTLVVYSSKQDAAVKPLLFLVLLFPLAAVAQSPNTGPPSKKEEGSIAGMVVKLGGSEPLRKARVMLTSLDDQTRRISVTSDS